MNVQQIKTAIENGANFNGTVYSKNNGKNWTTLFIYLDGKFTKIDEVAQKEAQQIKRELETELNAAPKTNAKMGFGEAYEKYGLDVAVGEAE
jgi:hypothetical protein